MKKEAKKEKKLKNNNETYTFDIFFTIGAFFFHWKQKFSKKEKKQKFYIQTVLATYLWFHEYHTASKWNYMVHFLHRKTFIATEMEINKIKNFDKSI